MIKEEKKMNNTRRKMIASIIVNLRKFSDYGLIEDIKNEIEDILWDEEDAYNNMPENLQYSIRGENSIDAINSLQEAIDTLERAVNILEEIEVLDDENEEDKIEKESRQNELNDYIDQAISSLEDIY